MDLWNASNANRLPLPPQSKRCYFHFVQDDVIKWKHFSNEWSFVRWIHRSPVNSHKGQWRRALMISFIWAWINGWVNNREAGDLRRHCAHYDVIVMACHSCEESYPYKQYLWHIFEELRQQSLEKLVFYICAIKMHVASILLADKNMYTTSMYLNSISSQ